VATLVYVLIETGFPRRSEAKRYLIVNADDLGLSDGVTEGVVRAWRDGIVTSTSALVNIEGAPERLAATHQTHPDMPIGLHLNIATGRPVLPPARVPTLVDPSGYFYPAATLLAHLAAVSLDELRLECHAQAALLCATGVRFDHLDYHEGLLALYPPSFAVVCELARAYRVPVRRPVPEDALRRLSLQGGFRATKAFLPALWPLLRFAGKHPVLALYLLADLAPAVLGRPADALRRERIAAPDRLIAAFYGHPTVERFLSILALLPPGVSEVLVHPGLVDAQLRVLGGRYVAQRESELAVLLDPRVRQACTVYGIELVDFSAVSRR
jgi:chitin disaccharide deacetylase